MNNNIVLIGFMGCGKTSVGKYLSNKLEYRFLDTDEQIEKLEKRKITDIFAENGEEYFRNLETKYLQRIQSQVKNTIISTGGGLPLKKENAVLLKKIGMIVYLRAKKQTIIDRLKKERSRPLLMGGDIEKKIETLLLQRKNLYEAAADVTLRTDGKIIEQIADEIICILREH